MRHRLQGSKAMAREIQDAEFYHCLTRCVRNGWLWGVDTHAGRDCSHRKHWVLDQLRRQSRACAIDVCAYAVLPNHYELVLHVDRRRAWQWSAEEVLERWQHLYTNAPRDTLEIRACATPMQIEVLRGQLCDFGWYMRCINQQLARRVRLEDGVEGAFWERDTEAHVLEDSRQLLVAMAHVDLSALRAGIAATFEASQLTSLTDRLQSFLGVTTREPNLSTLGEPSLMAFADSRPRRPPCAPWRAEDYLELLHWTSRTFRTPRPDLTATSLPLLLLRMHLEPDTWNSAMRLPSRGFNQVLQRVGTIRSHAHSASFTDLH
jgi:hypothetical protein